MTQNNNLNKKKQTEIEFLRNYHKTLIYVKFINLFI